MKSLSLHAVVTIGAVAIAATCAGAGCSSSSSGGTGGSSSGSASSSSGSSSGSASSSGSSSGSASSSGGTGSLPTITITAPTTNATVTVTKQTTGEVDVPVSFTTTNFTLKAPGSCGSVSKTCGHVHLYVDNDTCTPSGAPYNNDGQATPINAILVAGANQPATCPSSDAVNGSHTVRLELHADDHSAITDSTGATIENSVTFTAAGD